MFRISTICFYLVVSSMDGSSRIVTGFHGCSRAFAAAVTAGDIPISAWKLSQNSYDWLGRGIYFWEFSSTRAWTWAMARFGSEAAVLGADIDLRRCFDLVDLYYCHVLRRLYEDLVETFQARGRLLPENGGRDGKSHQLDCLVIEYAIEELALKGEVYRSVRGPFFEGEPIYPGSSLFRESHVQLAVRDVSCIERVFWASL